MKFSLTRLWALMLTVIICLSLSITVVMAEDEKTDVDIAFIIDATGSMSDEINNVKNNLNQFTTVLNDAGIDYRISVIEYKDITCDGIDSTVIHTYNGKTWFSSPDEVSDVLTQIDVDGGGDTPETVIDALGFMMSSALTFRTDASKFAFLLTDADYKNDNNYGYTDMASAIAALQEAGISTSVISSTSYQNSYKNLYEQTDGIFCNIKGNFAEELIKLAEYIKRAVRPVTISLYTSIDNTVDGSVTGSIYATITSTDEEEIVENMTVTLTLPEDMSIPEDVSDITQLERNVTTLAPGETVSFMWIFSVPLIEENARYTYTVTATSESFATGVVCKAQDTISIAGTAPTDYTYVFGEDNYSFLNSGSAFGIDHYDIDNKRYVYEEIYISESDLSAYLDNFNITELDLTAEWFAQDGVIENLITGNLKNWGGSCYGMSLTSALYKAGINNVTEDWNVGNVYDLTMSPNTNSALESYVNIYHMTQATDASLNILTAVIGDPDFPNVIQNMWDKALAIGIEGTQQQPYLVNVYCYNSTTERYEGGHAVVCFGAQSGTYTHKGESYSSRLRIYDPNSTKEEHIYIADDNSSAILTSYEECDVFGYNTASLNQLNTYDFNDSEMNYIAKLSASEMTDFSIESKKGKTVTIAGKVVEDELGIDMHYTVDSITEGDGASTRFVYLLPENDANYTIIPGEGELLKAKMYYEVGSFGVSGNAESVEFSADGKVTVKGAKGEITISLALNDSSLSFVEITGNADGDITVSLSENGIEIIGEIVDYTVSNLNRDGEEDSVSVEGNIDVYVEAVNQKDVEEIIAYFDSNKDGIYDTEIEKDARDEDYSKGNSFFFPRLHTVNVKVGEGGTTNVSDNFYIAYGASRTIKITPDEGYTVKDVTVNGKSVGAVTVYEIKGACEAYEVKITFEKID